MHESGASTFKPSFPPSFLPPSLGLAGWLSRDDGGGVRAAWGMPEGGRIYLGAIWPKQARDLAIHHELRSRAGR